jgi:polo-like kinase 1
MLRGGRLCVELRTILLQKFFKVVILLFIDNNGHSYEVDIWSLGIIAYAFVVGRPPFETSDVKTTYHKIKNCNYSFPDSIPLSQLVKKFISKMLMKDPTRRATID